MAISIQLDATSLCADIATGTSAKHALNKLGLSRQLLHQWCASDASLLDLYARARELQALAMADDTLDIADGIDIATPERLAALVQAIQGVDDGDKDRILASLTNAAVQRDRIRVDARKWMTAKVYPKVFGDRQVVEHELGESLTGLLTAAFTGAPQAVAAHIVAPVAVIPSPTVPTSDSYSDSDAPKVPEIDRAV